MPAATRPTVARAFAAAAALLFAAFVAAKGVPTLRHDWTWPVDRTAIGSFFSESIYGWLSSGFGTPNPHPTTYLVGPPIAGAMWVFGPLAALVLAAAVIGYVCAGCAMRASLRWNAAPPAAAGLALFAVFNPWVYNEVVAGHLVMVLAYGGVIGLVTEMARGVKASPVRLALWLALIEAQLQFFILAMCAVVAFAAATKKWMPPLAGTIFALPSIVGLIAERGELLRIPYGVTWQTNQSVAPAALLGLGGYFPGYSDRLGGAGAAAVWAIFALAVAGAVVARRSAAARWTFGAAVLLFVTILGVHGPLGAAYEWIVRHVPESGVFRELYDLVGMLAALGIVLAAMASARSRALGYVALAAGIVLPIAWLARPPSDLWIGAARYPHPIVRAPAFSRVALSPAFQPLALRAGGGDGADPDAHGYPDKVWALNEYFPTYPVDMALARYEQRDDVEALRALGVAEIVDRPWLISRTQGTIGLAARSMASLPLAASVPGRHLDGATPLISSCERPVVVTLAPRVGACSVFFGDAPGYVPVRPVGAAGDSIDPQSAWIDARLAFAKVPELAQAIGGAMTQSTVPQRVDSGAWLLAYVRGRLLAGATTLTRSDGTFRWLRVPPGVASVRCLGLCELVAQSVALPPGPLDAPPSRARALGFTRIAPWLYVVARADASPLLRLNERYDSGWVALASGRVLQHVRIDMAVNGWFVTPAQTPVVLLQVTSLLQLIAEAAGALCVLCLMKALVRVPTKRAP